MMIIDAPAWLIGPIGDEFVELRCDMNGWMKHVPIRHQRSRTIPSCCSNHRLRTRIVYPMVVRLA